MLSDRDYMRGPQGDRPQKTGGIQPMQMLFGLIIINTVAFFLVPQPTFYPGGRQVIPEVYQMLVLSWPGLQQGYWWQVVSSMFMHGSFFHLFFNMWGLYIFGQLIVNSMGTLRFLLLYFISGITGNLIWLAFNHGSPSYLLGASGALFGVMLAAAMFRPNVMFMMLFFPMPIRAKTLVVIYAIIEIISEWKVQDNIAHLVHLGGFVGAYIYLKIAYGNKMEWDPLAFLRGGKGKDSMRAPGFAPPPRDVPANGGKTTDISQQQVDEILDKLSRHGANSLSDADRAVLNEARKRYGKH
jgi:membrane associated rhomboid family serine protease